MIDALQILRILKLGRFVDAFVFGIFFEIEILNVGFRWCSGGFSLICGTFDSMKIFQELELYMGSWRILFDILHIL